MHIEYRPSQYISTLVKLLKGRSSRKLQMEFPDLKKRYWGRHFWAIGFGCWSTGNITDEMVDEYLEIIEVQQIRVIVISSWNRVWADFQSGINRIPPTNYTSKFPGKRSCNLLQG